MTDFFSFPQMQQFLNFSWQAPPQKQEQFHEPYATILKFFFLFTFIRIFFLKNPVELFWRKGLHDRIGKLYLIKIHFYLAP